MVGAGDTAIDRMGLVAALTEHLHLIVTKIIKSQVFISYHL